MQESMYTQKQTRNAKILGSTLARGIGQRPEIPTEIPMPPGEISVAVGNLNQLQCELTSRLECLCAKLGPILRETYPQEQLKVEVGSLPQTKIGREIQENCTRLEMTICIIKETTDRICL